MLPLKDSFQTRIFIIDDEPATTMAGAALLRASGYKVHSYSNSSEGLNAVRNDPPDLLLLDIRMPGMDGFDVLKHLRADPLTRSLPVIMLSVHAQEANIVAGLEMGADDFVRKPFKKRELFARVKAVLRRRDTVPVEEKLQIGPMHLNLSKYQVVIDGKEIVLEAREFQLLAFFARREGRVLTRSLIAEQVWGMPHIPSSRAIDVRVHELRKKLGHYGKWIEGLRGIGYRFEVEE